MTRDELEAVIWRNWPTRGTVAARAVDSILAAADAYADSRPPRPDPRRALHHISGTDLYPLIGVLAGAMAGVS